MAERQGPSVASFMNWLSTGAVRQFWAALHTPWAPCSNGCSLRPLVRTCFLLLHCVALAARCALRKAVTCAQSEVVTRTLAIAAQSCQTGRRKVQVQQAHAEAFGSGASGAAAAYRGLLNTPWVRALQSQVHTRPGYTSTASESAVSYQDAAYSASANAAETVGALSSDAQQPQLRTSQHLQERAVLLRTDTEPSDARSPLQQRLPTAAQLVSLEEIASLALTDLASLRKAAQLYPPLLSMSPDAVAARLLHLKSILPGAHMHRHNSALPMTSQRLHVHMCAAGIMCISYTLLPALLRNPTAHSLQAQM